MPERTCAHCRAPFSSPRPETRFCSRPCAQLGRPKPIRECLLCGGNFEARSGRAKYCPDCSSRDRTSKAGAPPRRIHCAQCGIEAVTRKLGGRYCSAECYHASTRRPEIPSVPCFGPLVVRRHPAWQELRLPSVGRRLWVSGYCTRCDKAFTVVDQATARYCSKRCLRGDSKDRRRALQRQAFEQPVRRTKIFERDNWTCQLCGKAVRRDAVAPHPLAPTIDHIVPLAEGGKHRPANVQCAHFLCNSSKNSGVFGNGEQLRLIG